MQMKGDVVWNRKAEAEFEKWSVSEFILKEELTTHLLMG